MSNIFKKLKSKFLSTKKKKDYTKNDTKKDDETKLDGSPTEEELSSENVNNIDLNRVKSHLICDDASSNRLVLKKYLNLYSCQVFEAENGAEGIQKVTAYKDFNVIWMDIKMPKMDGFQCTKHLRDVLSYKGKIIGLTGYVDDDTVKKCFEVGMDHVVSKPFDKNLIQKYCEEY